MFLYISLPSPAKQQREMTKFKVFWRTWAHDGEFFIFLPYLNAVSINSVPAYLGRQCTSWTHWNNRGVVEVSQSYILEWRFRCCHRLSLLTLSVILQMTAEKPTRLYFARAASLFCSLTLSFGGVLHDVAIVVQRGYDKVCGLVYLILTLASRVNFFSFLAGTILILTEPVILSWQTI